MLTDVIYNESTVEEALDDRYTKEDVDEIIDFPI